MSWSNSILAGAALAVLHTAAWADNTQTCATVTQKEIAALFDRWNQSLQTGNPDKVVANYAPDAVLLPTVSNTPRDTSAEIRDYFVHFLQKHPFGKIDQRMIKIGCNHAVDAGLYTFKLKGPDGKDVLVPARYSFTYELRGGKWLISTHHSSKMPEAAVAATH